jgi:hypothetical protein
MKDPANDAAQLRKALSDARSSALAATSLLRQLILRLAELGALSDAALQAIESDAVAELVHRSAHAPDAMLNMDLRDAAAKIPALLPKRGPARQG